MVEEMEKCAGVHFSRVGRVRRDIYEQIQYQKKRGLTGENSMIGKMCFLFSFNSIHNIIFLYS